MPMDDAGELIAQVVAAGGRLWLEDGQVRYSTPRNALSPELLGLLRLHKSDLVVLLAKQPAQNVTELPSARRGAPLPISCEELFFFDPLQNDRTGFPIIRTCLHLRGPWSSDILRRALTALVEQNEILRTAYIETDAGFRRVIGGPECFHINEIDATRTDETGLHSLIATEAAKDSNLLDLSTPPLFRAALFHRDAGEIVLLLTAHHITYDSASWAILVNRILALYLGMSSNLPTAPAPDLQYADYAAHQRQWLQSDAANPLLAYWHRKCTQLPPPLALGLDVHTGEKPVKRQTASIEIPREIAAKIAKMGDEAGASLFACVMALFTAVLTQRSGRDDIVVGTPFMTRQPANEMLGCMVDQLVFRHDVDLSRSFQELLKQVRQEMLDTYNHRPVPSDLIATQSGMTFDEFHHRAYSVMLVNQADLPGLDQQLVKRLNADGLHLALYAPPALAAAIDGTGPEPKNGPHVLSLLLSELERGGTIRGTLTCFRGGRAGQRILEEIVAQMRQLAIAIGDDPHIPLSTLLRLKR